MSEDRKKIESIINSFNSGNSIGAYKEIKNLVQNNNTNLNYVYTYALLSSKLGHEKEAIKNYNLILSKEPNNIKALSGLYPIFIKNKLFDESKILIDKLIKH